MKRALLTIVLLGLSTVPAYAAAPTETTVFQSGTEGYHTFRIPAIVKARDGALLAFAEARRASASDTGDIDLVMKRSTNGGKTWGKVQVVGDNGPNTFGNPAPVVDRRTGRIVLLSTHNAGTAHESDIRKGTVKPEDSRRVFVQHSDDNGRTWSKARDITPQTKQADWRWYATGPGHAISLRSGRMVVAANHSSAPPSGSSDNGTEAKYYDAHLVYSDDGGRNWHIGAKDINADGVVNGNESTAAELPDGRVYVNTRDQNGTSDGTRAATYSTDGGRSFTAPFQPVPALVAPVVQGSTLQVHNGPLLFSAPGDPTARQKMTVRASKDGGKTWPKSVEISTSKAAYSDLVQLKDDKVGLLYETGVTGTYERIVFHTFGVGSVG
ncbi:sialidase family protein [Allokutzneria oryzae]|uniref:exo-alpha-sialidase n=1 Tax=Allokutzneria oryzae TaxID=1378989 RepID=A0ABV5ZPL7_9PSEU